MLAYTGVHNDSLPQNLQQPKPVIWVLQGARVGDNAQADALASRLDGTVERKFLKFNLFHGLPNLVLGASTLSLKQCSRKELCAPWPTLVIATGKRSAPIARWIKRQSKGQTIIVQLGRARTPFDAFDLMITTPQYGLPPAANVVEIPLPFAARKEVDQADLLAWQAKWSSMRKPLIAVIVGNSKFPLRLGIREARLLGRQLDELARQQMGSLLLIASPRSAPKLVAEIRSGIHVPYVAYPSFDVSNNPYHAALALCDYFVATSDSISIISELIETGKPVDVFELPNRRLRVRWRAKKGFGAWLSRSGILQPPRDVNGMVRELIESGHVSVLGKQWPRSTFRRDDTLIFARLQRLLNGKRDPTLG